MTDEFTDADHAEARRAAAAALHLAMAGDLPGAVEQINPLNGTPGLQVAVLGWADTYIQTLHPEHQYGRPFAIAWRDLESTTPDAVLGAADVPAPVRWAGQIIAARAANDPDTYVALMQAPAEGADLGECIMALLTVVAANVDLARQGRTDA